MSTTGSLFYTLSFITNSLNYRRLSISVYSYLETLTLHFSNHWNSLSKSRYRLSGVDLEPPGFWLLRLHRGIIWNFFVQYSSPSLPYHWTFLVLKSSLKSHVYVYEWYQHTITFTMSFLPLLLLRPLLLRPYCWRLSVSFTLSFVFTSPTRR